MNDGRFSIVNTWWFFEKELRNREQSTQEIAKKLNDWIVETSGNLWRRREQTWWWIEKEQKNCPSSGICPIIEVVKENDAEKNENPL